MFEAFMQGVGIGIVIAIAGLLGWAVYALILERGYWRGYLRGRSEAASEAHEKLMWALGGEIENKPEAADLYCAMRLYGWMPPSTCDRPGLHDRRRISEN